MEQLRALEEREETGGGCRGRGSAAESTTAGSGSIHPDLHGALVQLGPLSARGASKNESGFRTFLEVGPRDDGLKILHYCAQRYLCHSARTIT